MISQPLFLLQASLDPSGEGSATWVLHLHSALFSTSVRSTRKSSMLYFTPSIHLFLHLPQLRCPHTSASKILLTQSSSSRHCTCPNHLNLASRTLSVMHTTLRMRRISSFLFLSLNVRPRIHLSILIPVLSKTQPICVLFSTPVIYHNLQVINSIRTRKTNIIN